MRPTLIVAVSTVVSVVVAIWGFTAIIIVRNPQDANAAPVSASIDAMQMMKNASNLPVEQFDAH